MTLERWLKDRGDEILARRDQDLAQLKTPADVQRYQDRLREIVRRRMGVWVMQRIAKTGRPRAIPAGQIAGDGFIIEKFLFEAADGMWVPTVLWRPAESKGRLPALVMPVGHWWEGKATAVYQRLMRVLARRGVICVSFDGAGHGERVEPFAAAVAEGMSDNRATWEITPSDKRWEPLPWVWNDGPCHGWLGESNVTSLHCVIGDPAYLAGISPGGVTAIAGKRLIDLLVSRKDVDPKRIGGCGASGGGNDLRVLQAMDDRLAAIAPTSIVGTVRNITGGDADQSLFGTTADGIASSDLLVCHAPRPMLLVSSSEDKHNVKAVADFYRPTWAAAGSPDNIEWGIGEGLHGFPKPTRKIIAEFVLRHLAGDSRPIGDDEDREDEAIFPEPQLWTTPSGNLSVENPKWTYAAMLEKQTRQLAKARKPLAGAELRAAVLDTVRESEQSVSRKPADVQAGETEIRWTNEGVPVRLVGDVRSRTVILREDGDSDWQQSAVAQLLTSQLPTTNYQLPTPNAIALEVRGCGATAAGRRIIEGQLLRWLVTGTDSNLARLALHQDRTLLGMRMVDLLQAADILGGPITVLADGAIGFAALLAAAVRPEAFAKITLYRAPLTWQSLMTIGGRAHNFAHYPPGVLEKFDTPALVAALPNETVTWVTPVDVAGMAAPEPACRELRSAGAIVVRGMEHPEYFPRSSV